MPPTPAERNQAIGQIPPDRANLPRPALPAPASSGIDHIVLVTMENRSFDHLLGWVPNAEGLPAGRQFTDAFGAVDDRVDVNQRDDDAQHQPEANHDVMVTRCSCERLQPGPPDVLQRSTKTSGRPAHQSARDPSTPRSIRKRIVLRRSG